MGDGEDCPIAEDCIPGAGLCTSEPSEAPSVSSPTEVPSNKPSLSPTPSPTEKPSMGPTKAPSKNPSPSPTPSPTDQPSMSPSPSPTPSPTDQPSKNPSPSPTEEPSLNPSSSIPTEYPTQAPTCYVCNYMCGESHYECASQEEARQTCESNGRKLCSRETVVDHGQQVCAYMYTSSSTTQGMYVGFGSKGCGQADKLMLTTESHNGIGMFDAACCPLDANEGTRFRLSVVEKSKWNWNPSEVEFYSDARCSTRIPNSEIVSLQSNPPDVLSEQNGKYTYPLENLIDGSTSSFWYGVPDCRANCDDSWVEFQFSQTVAIGCYKLYQRQIKQDDRFASAVMLSVQQDGQWNDFCSGSGLTSGNWATIQCGVSSEKATSALTQVESVMTNDFLFNGLAVIGVVSVVAFGYNFITQLGKQDYETIHDGQEI